ncbi:hypothetical protein C4D60_Mb05t20800 [Musa balbisiana]|uniref:Uncharacterized protein n=1 Tax=Musa balbisiana TaxID=52838 RepID=A0A4S8JXN3_MUSBA|nr:hypothetical protein C4D60_Mb05t20800 [Musa balbisiana]
MPPRDHTCAASPPASCPSASCRPRPHQRGLPACVVLLGSSAACLPETTPARPARLRRVPRPLGPSAPCAANTLPRPHAQPTRCLGPSAPCAASPLPRPLGPMRSQHAASAPCAASPLPRPLGPMRS